jgi:hypothetical protein
VGDERLHVATRGAVTEIEFDHPPINIYDIATRDALCEVLTAVIADPGVRVVVFRATGDHFSAGADLEEFGTAPSLFAMRDARWGRDVWGLLRAVPVPMLASMQGNAVGFGFELALHAHPHQLRVERQLRGPVGRHAVATLPCTRSDDVEAARHLPEHATTELVVLLGIVAGRDRSDDSLVGGHARRLATVSREPGA